MKHSVYIETPFGDFQLVRTNTFKGSSCEQCALNGLGHCHEVDCSMFDTDGRYYHFVRRFV